MHGSVALRAFVGIDIEIEGAPIEKTVCQFRHPMERSKLDPALLTTVNDNLHPDRVMTSKDMILGAAIIGAPSSTNSVQGKRDTGRSQKEKGPRWFSEMRAHIGVETTTKIVHITMKSAANVHDLQARAHPVRGTETRVSDDPGYHVKVP